MAVDGITNILAQVVSESAVNLLPGYFAKNSRPGVTFVQVSDAKAHWDFIDLWQNGGVSASTRALVEALKQVAAEMTA